MKQSIKIINIPIIIVSLIAVTFLLLGCDRVDDAQVPEKYTEGNSLAGIDSIVQKLGEVTSPMERAIYHFKMGEAYDNAEDSYKAMEEFLEAEKLSMDLKNDLLKGRIYWYKGKLYHARLDYTNALNMYTLALEYYTNAERKEDMMYTYQQMAQVYSASKKLEEAIIYFNKAKAIAMELRNKEIYKPGENRDGSDKYNKLLLNFSTAISGVYFSQLNSSAEALEQLKEAYSLYNNDKVNEEDYLLLSCIYLDAGKISLAREFADKYAARGEKISGYQLAGLLLHKSSIEKQAGDFRKALLFREEYDAVMDSLSLVERNSSMREMEQQYWQRELQVENSTMKVRNMYVIIIYSLLLLVTGVIIYNLITAYRRRMIQKDIQLEEYLATIGNLGDRINVAESSKNNLLGQLDVHIEKEKKLKDLLENRFSEVRELVRTYYEFGNSKKLQKKVDDLLKLQLSGDNFEVIEEVVNAKNNNAIKKVREQFPTLKEDNLKLLNLIYAGFSAQEISVILNDTPQNIYVRKSRLKKSLSSIIESDPEMNFN